MKKRATRSRKGKPSGPPALPPVWLGIAAIVLIGGIAYGNTFDVPLVFDDFVSIQRNSTVRFGDYLQEVIISSRSLLYLTFTLNYVFAGQDVWSYHLVNLILHLANGVLMLLVAGLILRKVIDDEYLVRWYSILAAGFFLVHPVQTESVTYISSRSELLSTLFFLGAFLLFIKMPKERIGFLLSLPIAVILFLGLLSKETVITLPAVLVLYDFIFLSEGRLGSVISRWRFYITFVLGGSAVSYYILTGPLSGSVGANLVGHLSVSSYFLTQLRVLVRYIQILFVPVGLNLDYDFEPSISPFEPAVLLSSAILVSIVALAWHLRRSQPIFSFSIFWFFVTLAPTSSIFPILDVIFEHRLYLPMVGLCLSFPLLVAFILRLLNEKSGLAVRALPVGVSILLILTVATSMRNQIWRDEVTLWTDVVSKSPDKPRAYNALAMTYFRRTDFDKALEITRAGLQRMPDRKHEFVDTLGNIYLRTRRYEEAAAAFKDSAASTDNPTFAAMEYNNVGVSYLNMRRDLTNRRNQMSEQVFETERLRELEEARKAFERSLELDDGFSPLDSLINVMSELGRSEELRVENEAVLKEDPDNFRSLYTLGKLAFNANDFGTTVAYFDDAVKVNPNEELIWFNYGYALEQLRRPDEAVEKYLQAIRVEPIFIEAHHNVALVYMTRKEFPTAIDHLEEVLQTYPDHVSTNLHLAKIYMQTGDDALARQYLQVVLEGSPDHQEAISLWQQLL